MQVCHAVYLGTPAARSSTQRKRKQMHRSGGIGDDHDPYGHSQGTPYGLCDSVSNGGRVGITAVTMAFG